MYEFYVVQKAQNFVQCNMTQETRKADIMQCNVKRAATDGNTMQGKSHIHRYAVIAMKPMHRLQIRPIMHN